MFDDGNRAIGVEYQKGERLYAAHPGASAAAGENRIAQARREVILAGGAFNTPQLLMLSGIGDPDLLGKCGIRTRVPLPGVGRNLQDRYEVPVVNRMEQPGRCSRAPRSPPPIRSIATGPRPPRGLHDQRGPALRRAALRGRQAGARSVLLRGARRFPRLQARILGACIRKRHDCLTWVVLKGHTNNRGGSVTITSPNPRARPAINFRYFEEGTDASGDDLQRSSTASSWSAG